MQKGEPSHPGQHRLTRRTMSLSRSELREALIDVVRRHKLLAFA